MIIWGTRSLWVLLMDYFILKNINITNCHIFLLKSKSNNYRMWNHFLNTPLTFTTSKNEIIVLYTYTTFLYVLIFWYIIKLSDSFLKSLKMYMNFKKKKKKGFRGPFHWWNKRITSQVKHWDTIVECAWTIIYWMRI